MIQFAVYRLVLAVLGLALACYAFTTPPAHSEQAWLQIILVGVGLVLMAVGLGATFTRSTRGK